MSHSTRLLYEAIHLCARRQALGICAGYGTLLRSVCIIESNTVINLAAAL